MDDSVLKALYEAQKACMRRSGCNGCVCCRSNGKNSSTCSAKLNLIPCEFGIVEKTEKVYRLEGDETL